MVPPCTLATPLLREGGVLRIPASFPSTGPMFGLLSLSYAASTDGPPCPPLVSHGVGQLFTPGCTIDVRNRVRRVLGDGLYRMCLGDIGKVSGLDAGLARDEENGAALWGDISTHLEGSEGEEAM